MLRANNLVVRIGTKALLQPTSIWLNAGECVAILGPNGAGKSTLLSCLSGERGSEVGRVFLDDVALDEWRGSTTYCSYATKRCSRVSHDGLASGGTGAKPVR